MGFPGTWMTETESLVYRVVPKCACSTIGQIMYYSDQGEFFDGDIHDAKGGMHKWALEHSQGPITKNVQSHESYSFTCVRNPYTRILSSFFDKICGIQRNGKRYRGNLVPLLIQNMASKLVVMMANKSLTKSNPSVVSYCSLVIPFGSAVQWTRIFTGQQCPVTSARLS